MAQQTIRDFVEECKCYEYSTEYYNLMKEASEIDLMEKYLENQEFALENAEFINVEGGYSFTEGMFIESSSVDLNQSYYLMEKKDKKKSGFFATIWKAIKRLFEKIANFFKKLFGAAQKSRSAKKEADKIWKKIGGEKTIKEWIKKYHGVEGAVDKIGSKTEDEEVRRKLAKRVRKVGEDQQKERDEATQKQIDDLKDKLNKTRKSLAEAKKKNASNVKDLEKQSKDIVKRIKDLTGDVEDLYDYTDSLDEDIHATKHVVINLLRFVKTKKGLNIYSDFAQCVYAYIAEDAKDKTLGNFFSKEHSNRSIVYHVTDDMDKLSQQLAEGDHIKVKVDKYDYNEKDPEIVYVLSFKQLTEIMMQELGEFSKAAGSDNKTNFGNIDNMGTKIENLKKKIKGISASNVTKGFEYPVSPEAIQKEVQNAETTKRMLEELSAIALRNSETVSPMEHNKDVYTKADGSPMNGQEVTEVNKKHIENTGNNKDLYVVVSMLTRAVAEMIELGNNMKKFTDKFTKFTQDLAFTIEGKAKKEA